MKRLIITAALTALLAPVNANAHAIECTVKSGQTKVALLELYTSEGCDSCPPADRWLSGLADRGLGMEKLVPLALHVDYWNYLGWADRFSQPQFSQRQRAIAARNHGSTVYTPQRILNGHDLRPASLGDDTRQRVEAINQAAPGASIELRQTGTLPQVNVSITVAPAPAVDSTNLDTYVALIENGLESAVTRGENRGKRLRHDHVVRAWSGPWGFAAKREQRLSVPFTLSAETDPARSGLVVFVENRRTGDVLQALGAGLCAGASPR